MEFKPDCKTALLVPSSMGVRLTPQNGQPFHAGSTLEIQVTSAETNVASVSSYLGLPVTVLTTFVKDSPVSRLIRDNLAARHMTVEGPEVEQGSPWGYRHQFNLADSGYGSRGPRVQNDRAGEVGRLLDASAFDLDRMFGEDGVQAVHLSGLIAALSEQTSAFCLDLARIAKECGSRISFDLNHRASFWKGREAELRRTFLEIASLSDILVGNEEDFQLCLGLEGPEPGGKDLQAQIDGFNGMIDRARDAFPVVEIFATTLREVVHANHHRWGCIVSGGEDRHIVEPRDIHVHDRIGGGDGFVGGLLYGLLRGWTLEQATQFGWASGALAATLLTDYAQPADEKQIWSIWSGNARVVR